MVDEGHLEESFLELAIAFALNYKTLFTGTPEYWIIVRMLVL